MKKEKNIIKVGIPGMGIYGNFMKKTFGDAFLKVGITNLEFVVSPKITRKTVNCGAQHMDENMCLPSKIILGNVLELHGKGIEIILEWDNCGPCRQGTYALVHESTLRQLGVDVKIFAVRSDNMFAWIQALAPGLSRSKQLSIVRDILRELWKFDQKIIKKQQNIPTDKPKIGICGEIYTVLEPAANMGLIEKLEGQGAFVHNALPLSQFLFEDLLMEEKRTLWAIKFGYLKMYKEIIDWCIKKMRRSDVDYKLMRKAEKLTQKYFPGHDSFAGHARESITWTIYYALAGFDGVVHILPFPCMPEATVITILEEVSKDFGIPINHLVFDQQLGEQNLITRAEALVNILRFKKQGLDSILRIKRPGYWIGVDVGSTSTKAVLLDGSTHKIIDQEYQFSNRNPMAAIKTVVNEIIRRNPDKQIMGGATTGSGRSLAKSLLDAPLAVDEITCQVIGCMLSDKSVRSIIEIGGQDSKFIGLDQHGIPSWFNMNSICSAGTGAFLSSAAREFNIPIEELGKCAQSADCGVSITGRCSVFAESDIVSKQQLGYPVNQIVKGTCSALAQNYISNVCKSKVLVEPIMFTGAVSLNEGVVDAFVETINKKVKVHPNQRVSGAIGAAFMALARNMTGGFDTCNPDTKFGSYVFNCHDCSNNCEVSLIHRDNYVVCALGSRCGKHEIFSGQNLEDVILKI